MTVTPTHRTRVEGYGRPALNGAVSRATGGTVEVRLRDSAMRGRWGRYRVGMLWALLLDLAPFRRRVTAAVDEAVRQESATAQRVIDELRERQRKELARRDEGLAAARWEVAELRRQLEELRDESERRQRAVLALHGELQAVEDERRARAQAEAAADERTEVDLFACAGCSSVVQLNTRPDNTCDARRLGGTGCGDCLDLSFGTLWAAKASATTAAAPCAATAPNSTAVSSGTAVPSGTADPDSATDPAAAAMTSAAADPVTADRDLPEDRDDRRGIAAKFVVDLLADDMATAVAKGVVREAGELARSTLWPADRCATLSAIANGLAPIPTAVKKGIRWVATVVGAPRLVAETIAEAMTRALVEPIPLRAIAQTLRVVGVLACVADDQLSHCQCARDLVTKDLAEPALAHRLDEALERALASQAVASPAVPEPKPPAIPNPGDSAIKGPRFRLW
ncbi:hypothetical protein Aglo01_45340 [Actinokineospora globicatena]|nr:hypothetical protein Aglo01_45340 [Actinokineospora globicatena]GLW86882.1 hypothetical protein Aglo02_45210 [Actinokineospora globicatena]